MPNDNNSVRNSMITSSTSEGAYTTADELSLHTAEARATVSEIEMHSEVSTIRGGNEEVIANETHVENDTDMEHADLHNESDEAADAESFLPEHAAVLGGPLEMTKTGSRSITSSRLRENSVYGVEMQHKVQADTESYSLALQRTLSRKSLSDKLHNKEEFKKEYVEEMNTTKDLSALPQPGDVIDAATLDWEGLSDPDRPGNWPAWKQWYAIMIVAILCLYVSFGSSLYVDGLPFIMREFKVSQELALAGLTFYLIGLAFGPAIAAPLSEIFGRKVVYLLSLPLGMLFTMGVGLSKNIESVLVLRFFAGLFNSPALAIGGGTISDIFGMQPEMMGVAMCCFCMCPFLGPVLGPIMSFMTVNLKSWKWTMWLLLIFGGAILPFIVIMPETYKPIILKKRAQKRGFIVQRAKVPVLHLAIFYINLTLIRPMKMLFTDPIIFVFSLYTAFVFAVLFGFFEAFPIIFRGVYHMKPDIGSLPFLGVGVGLFTGAGIYLLLDRFIIFKKNPDGSRGPRDENGMPKMPVPESILIVGKFGAVLLPPALFWLGWSSKASVHWICPVISAVPFGAGLILIFFAVMSYFSMAFPPLMVASAISANNMARYIISSVFPLFTVQMYEKLHIDWATSLLGFITIALLPMPWLFEKWGPRLRQRSPYGWAAMARAEEKENVELESEEERIIDEIEQEQAARPGSLETKESDEASMRAGNMV